MSLATRCPVCSTVFRVVQDQLKVSEGWVRCGRCAKVFNAFEGLFDLERELASMTPPQVSASQRVLEDLAQRNRQPRQKGEFTGDEFPDTGASVRVNSTPAAAPSSRLWPRTPSGFGGLAPQGPPVPGPAPRSRAAGEPTAPDLPAWAASRPASLHESGSGPKTPAWPTSVPGALGVPASGGAGRPPSSWPTSRPAPMTPAAEAPPVSAPMPMTPAPPTPTPTPVPAPVPTGTAASEPAVAAAPPAPVEPAPAKVSLKDAPAPMEPPAPEGEASDGSYESLFRSTGELDPATAHPSGLDIVLDEDEARRADATDSQLLSFVQEADKAARWQQPKVRAALGLAAVALSLTLVAQIALAERDLVAVRWPAARSWLTSLCGVLNCRVEPLRRIERLAVESSGLTRIGEGQVYRLAMVLRNRGDLPLMLPAVDLSLTDASGALVARRVLTSAELGAAGNAIAAGQELPLQVLLRSGERPVTGYTVEIFYP